MEQERKKRLQEELALMAGEVEEKSSQGMMGGRLTSCKRETNLASNQGMTCHIINLGHKE